MGQYVSERRRKRAHRLHFSLDSTCTSCWTIMPGPARRCTIFFSFGHAPHDEQRGRCALFLQLRHKTRLRYSINLLLRKATVRNGHSPNILWQTSDHTQHDARTF